MSISSEANQKVEKKSAYINMYINRDRERILTHKPDIRMDICNYRVSLLLIIKGVKYS